MQDSTRQIFTRLYPGDFSSLRQDWDHWLEKKALIKIVTPNPEQLMLAERSPDFAQSLLSAQVLLPDGIGLVTADALLFRRPSSQARLAGVEVVEWWLREGAQGRTKTLLLGGFQEAAKKVAQRFDLTGEWCRAVTGYQIAAQPTAGEEAAVLNLLQTWRPEVIFVAFGAPTQEKWLQDHEAELAAAGVRIAMVCGGAFDFLSGAVPRAPRFWRKLGLEWLFRLIKQPWRWKRQLRLGEFILFVLRELLQNGRR